MMVKTIVLSYASSYVWYCSAIKAYQDIATLHVATHNYMITATIEQI